MQFKTYISINFISIVELSAELGSYKIENFILFVSFPLISLVNHLKGYIYFGWILHWKEILIEHWIAYMLLQEG